MNYRNLSPIAHIHRTLAVAVMSVIAFTTPLAAQELKPEYLMTSDPELIVPSADPKLPDGIIALWRQTLQRPESDLVKAAAESIVKAQVAGFSGLEECRPELLAILKIPDSHPAVTYVVCRALIELDSSDDADLLLKASQQGRTQLRMLVEPALAAWGSQPIHDVWHSRLKDPATPRRELILACEGVRTVGDQSAVPSLIAIIHSPNRPSDLRLAAARAAGELSTSGLETDAATLVSSSSSNWIDKRCAALLLHQQTSVDAQQLLTGLATHANPTIAAPALKSLLNIDPELVLPLADQSLASPDPKVRQCGLDAYVSLVNEERLSLIAAVLDDVHPDVRTSARQAMGRFGRDEQHRKQVLELATALLSGSAWRAQEQAAILLVALDHQAAATRLVELLDSERPEVMITAAWGLRMLAVPETTDAILAKIKKESINRPAVPFGDLQMAHLFEACVILGDERALPIMRRYVAKDLKREKSRSAAIWALGKFLEGTPDDALADKLTERMTDTDDPNGNNELELVRRMCAITTGRMRAESQLRGLQQLVGSDIDAGAVEYAMGWAIEQITGETLPKPPPPRKSRRGWLIEPVMTDAR